MYQGAHQSMQVWDVCTSPADKVMFFWWSLVLAAAVGFFRCFSPVCNVSPLQLNRCAPRAHTHTHKHIRMWAERETWKPPFPSSLLKILPHLVGGTGTSPICAGVGPVWLMGLSEMGRDPCSELLPVSVEVVFRGLQWSQAEGVGSRSTSSLGWCCHSKRKNIHQQSSGCNGRGGR